MNNLDVPEIYSLSIHADYRCRHSGQCCSTDWDVPIELPVYRSLAQALTAGRLQVDRMATALEPFVVDPALPQEAAAIFQRTDRGSCVFLDSHSRLCIVHRDLGEPALAATCRHFPRVSVQDARGTFVGLSHFCPTAASMLFREDVPLAIVSSPPAFPRTDYDGLTVGADEYPPLLHPHMLMDLDGYAAWESHMVARCVDVTRRPESVLATLRRDAELLVAWRPGGKPLRDAIAVLPAACVDEAPARTLDESLRLYAQCADAVPAELRSPDDFEELDVAFERHVAPAWRQLHPPVTRYIAAKSFACWTAYQGRGVRTIVRGIEAAVALVRVEAARQCRDASRVLDAELLLEAFRSADFILNHQAVGEDLAENWGRGIGEW